MKCEICGEELEKRAIKAGTGEDYQRFQLSLKIEWPHYFCAGDDENIFSSRCYRKAHGMCDAIDGFVINAEENFEDFRQQS